MSDVRLSNGSPPLERVDARLADHSRPPVCRNLFPGGGAGDAAELRRDCTEQLREMERASRDKWNFDFARDQPLAPGQYEWEAVDDRSVPEFYSRPPRGVDSDRPAERAPTRTSPTTNTSTGLENGAAAEGGGERTESSTPPQDCRETRKRPSEQQDGATQSKRVNSEAEGTNGEAEGTNGEAEGTNGEAEERNHCPDESPSEEQTPRKQPNT